ncbi:MAG: hypothetical protein IJT70_05700 [Clostridia bacterium]|nr:hypothetical protein [Clostridia bacterium]
MSYYVSDSDSVEALKNDYTILKTRYNKKYVRVTLAEAKPGEALCIALTVYAPTHYMTGSGTPISCDEMTVYIVAYPRYPETPVIAFYPKDRILCSVNVFSSGLACIDPWKPFTSSLITVADKLLNDIIHNPVVSKYNSPANPYNLQGWHKANVEEGNFPTLDPKLLYASELPDLPRRKHTPASALPPMPPRKIERSIYE